MSLADLNRHGALNCLDRHDEPRAILAPADDTDRALQGTADHSHTFSYLEIGMRFDSESMIEKSADLCEVFFREWGGAAVEPHERNDSWNLQQT